MNQNILVVDDDREIVDAIEFYLRPDNFNVLKAYDGLEALDILIENDIKLIIMDVMMPNLDGLKTTLKIREKKEYTNNSLICKIRRYGQNYRS